MRCNLIFAVTAIFLCSAVVAKGKPASNATSSEASNNPISTDPARICATPGDSPHQTEPAENISQSSPQARPDPVSSSDTPDAAPVVVHVDDDLKILEQHQSGLAQCIQALDPQNLEDIPEGACLGELLVNFEARHHDEFERDVPIGRIAGNAAFFYESGMTIDADGAPNAYHPDNVGLDDLSNAGAPGRWEGLAKDPDGQPYIQGPDDPYPGYYVSETALADRSKPVNDPARYVDASKIPFVVLPGGMARQLGARPGDFAAVFNQRNGKSSFAIFGDVGPWDHIGEGSVALAENLDIRSDARNGGARRGILYLVFPGSGNGRPRTIEEINAEGEKLLQAWEDSVATAACVDPHLTPAAETNAGGN